MTKMVGLMLKCIFSSTPKCRVSFREGAMRESASGQ